MSELNVLPCANCGGKASLMRYGNSNGGASYSVSCDACSISTAWAHAVSEDDAKDRAATAWNRRATQPASAPADDACTLCDGSGELDADGMTCPHCDGRKVEPAVGAPQGQAEQVSKISASPKSLNLLDKDVELEGNSAGYQLQGQAEPVADDKEVS